MTPLMAQRNKSGSVTNSRKRCNKHHAVPANSASSTNSTNSVIYFLHNQPIYTVRASIALPADFPCQSYAFQLINPRMKAVAAVLFQRRNNSITKRCT